MSYYVDECGHGGYVGSFQSVNYKSQRLDNYDLYIFESDRVCIRYGKEPSEYISPGDILNLALHAKHNNVYFDAVTCLKENGSIRYERK